MTWPFLNPQVLEALHTYIHTLLARPHGAFQSQSSVLVKEGRSPTTSRLARLALVFRHSCDDISTPRLPNSTFYFDEGHKFLMLDFPFSFLNNPFLTLKIWLQLEMASCAKSCCFSFIFRNYLRFDWWVSRVLPVCFLAWISWSFKYVEWLTIFESFWFWDEND